MEEPQEPKYLLIDWRIDMLMSMEGATFTFQALPMAEGAQQTGALPPFGIGIQEMRRLHADLGELIRLADSRGTPQPGAFHPQ